MAPGNYFTVLREPHDDEWHVMTAYERHSSRCLQCVKSLKMQQGDWTLCDRGYKYARDVANYLYAHDGKHFSIVASENGRRIQIKIPQKVLMVRRLLAAIEDGLNLYPRQSITTVQSYHIRSGQSAPKHIQPQYQSPKLETYNIIERRPQKAESQILPHRFLYKHPRHRLLYVTERQSEAPHIYRRSECYPRVRA